MNSNDIHGLPVINLADGSRAGTIDELFLDLEAKRIVGVSITHGTGLFGRGGGEAPTIAVSATHALGPDALTVDDVTAAHEAWVAADYGAMVPLGELVGRKVLAESGTREGQVAAVEFDDRTFALTGVEVAHGLLKARTRIPLEQIVRFGQDVLVVRDEALVGEADHLVASGARAGAQEGRGDSSQRDKDTP
jgi:sporulation protein YlmC with PRC-barrel domain